MERRPLGATGVEVPVVGMGTWRTFDVRGHEAEPTSCGRPTTERRSGRPRTCSAGTAGWVDIYEVHNLVRLDERLAQLRSMRNEGTVRVVGATHYQHAAFPALLVMRP